jgi:hypothetical protein
MTWFQILLLLPLWGVPALWVLYPVAIQYERAGMGQSRAWLLCYVFVLPALIIDVLVNWTSLAVIFGWPRRGEWTFSTHLARLYGAPEESNRRSVARYITTALNCLAPSGRHIVLQAPQPPTMRTTNA